MGDLFSTAGTPAEGRAARTATAARPEGDDGPGALEVFEAQLLGRRRTDWRTLFQGYRRLKAITYSSSIPALLAVADLFEEMEILFGSERVLGRELGALEDATAVAGYRFVDAVADQKAAIERLLRPTLRGAGSRSCGGSRRGACASPCCARRRATRSSTSWRARAPPPGASSSAPPTSRSPP